MARCFLFLVPNLNYAKNDLNIPLSEGRHIIGQLARMITNALFLSHSLRQQVLIRIFVAQPTPHLYQIKSETIRYLGPEMRSSASILLKAEKFVEESIQRKTVDSIKWHQPNPGLFLKFTSDPFSELDSSIEIIPILSNGQFEQVSSISLFTLETMIKEISQKENSLIFCFIFKGLTNHTVIKDLVTNNHSIIIENNLPFANVITHINLILDKIEKKE